MDRLYGIMPLYVCQHQESSQKKGGVCSPLTTRTRSACVFAKWNSVCVCVCGNETVCARVAGHVAWCVQQLLSLPLHELKEVFL